MMDSLPRWLLSLAILSLLSIGQDGSAVEPEESLSDLAFPPVLTQKAKPKPWGRDPFESNIRPAASPQPAESERETARMGSLSLTAVISRQGEGMAIINHEIVRKGDQIAGMKIVDIGKDRVMLQDSGGPVELRLTRFTVGMSDRSGEVE